MFEHKLIIVIRDINDNLFDLAVLQAAVYERSEEWDNCIETGKIDGRPIYVGDNADGQSIFECLVRDSEQADYMMNAYQELNTRFSEPMFTVTLEPNVT